MVLRLTKLFAQREGMAEPPITDAEAERFITAALGRAGAEEMITPREIIRDYLTLLTIMRDNPTARFDELVGRTELNTVTESIGAKTEILREKTEQKSKIGLFDIEI